MSTWKSITIRHVDNEGIEQEVHYNLGPYCSEQQQRLDDRSIRIGLDFITDGPPIDSELATRLPRAVEAKLTINRVQALIDHGAAGPDHDPSLRTAFLESIPLIAKAMTKEPHAQV